MCFKKPSFTCFVFLVLECLFLAIVTRWIGFLLTFLLVWLRFSYFQILSCPILTFKFCLSPFWQGAVKSDLHGNWAQYHRKLPDSNYNDFLKYSINDSVVINIIFYESWSEIDRLNTHFSQQSPFYVVNMDSLSQDYVPHNCYYASS